MAATQEEVLEALVDLTCDVLERHGTEGIRRKAQEVRLMDHSRRLVRDGKHPELGETREEYADRIRVGRGVHPVTGETLEDFEKSAWGKTAVKPAK